MSTIERVLELNTPINHFGFTYPMVEALRFRGDWISTHPSGTSTNLTVYEGEAEEHFIPIFAITSVSLSGQKASE